MIRTLNWVVPGPPLTKSPLLHLKVFLIGGTLYL